jgi:hypothetical protein
MKIRDRQFGQGIWMLHRRRREDKRQPIFGSLAIFGSGTIYEEWNLIRLARAGDTGTGN